MHRTFLGTVEAMKGKRLPAKFYKTDGDNEPVREGV